MAGSGRQRGPPPVEWGFGPSLKDDARDEPIAIRGARVHNLKGLDCDIPRNRLVVITGPSGSGKSSLAFDTLYAEGQRRYVESLSPWARQFLEQMDRPEVESVTGLSPAIAIEQRTTVAHPRSTVGTVTEIYDHLRLLFATLGRPHCPRCGEEVAAQSADEMAARLVEQAQGAVAVIAAPGRPRPQGRLPQGAAGGAPGRAAAGAHRRPRREPRRPARARSAPRAPHRRAGRSPGAPKGRRGAPAPGPGEGARARARGRAGVGRGPRRAPAEPGARVCALRRADPGARPARLLLQQRPRGLPGLRRARPTLGGRRRARDSRRVEERPRRGDPALAPARPAPAARGARSCRGAPRLLARGAGRRAAAARRARCCCSATTRASRASSRTCASG